ncbi:MAG TPA: dihydrolipoyllysine-residue acetyltransferase [Candidatus Binataceae bacterium]|nr:dihydrolipoyllysine-residue acetyltransferase [Candidatus Binataceae bacterium]
MGTLIDVKVPDIGDFTDVDVIEVMVKPGDRVRAEDSLITIESDKATMEVPSPRAGVIKELKVKLGDKVSEGSAIVVLEADAEAGAAPAAAAPPKPPPQPAPEKAAPRVEAAVPPDKQEPQARSAPPRDTEQSAVEPVASPPVPAPETPIAKPHASPSVRKFARILGADLTLVAGSGLKGRIFRTDVEKYVKAALTSAPKTRAGAGLELIAWPKVDFTRFGAIETRPLSRIRRASKANLARNWVMIPHVTQFDEADVTELEALRREVNEIHAKDGVRTTMLAFIIKAMVAALAEFPDFNASLDGDNLILKKYFHIAFAADTPDGLVVPVVRDADKKGVLQIARETALLAAAARAGKLKPMDIQGGCITVSSLGGIGGTAFTPIINAPEVAILGVAKLATKPVYREGQFVARLMLPLSLSYDHRVIDGAMAARFITYLGSVLADMRRALL